MIKALVFDFDGLILDTETAIYKATKAIFNEHGAELPISIWSNLAGTYDESFDLSVQFEKASGKAIDKNVFLEMQRKRIMEYIEKEEILPGVLPLLEMGKELGLRIALATSSGDQWAKNHLERLGIIDYFEAIVEANDVEKVKPDPALYAKAVEALGIKPEEAIAFEDSYHGMVAAKRAGLYCVVVPNEVTKSLDFSEADYTLKSLADISVEELIKAFSSEK